MAIKLKLTKKWKIIIIIIFILILGGSGGYLLWRTNQPDTVAPTDSEAGSNQCNCCPSGYTSQDTSNVKNYYPGCVACNCTYRPDVCKKGSTSLPQCPGTECSKGSQCPACTWPNVGFCESGKCVCKKYNTASIDPCNDTSPQCSLNCDGDYEDPYFIDAGQSCASGEQSVSCSASCAGCDNPYVAKGCCKPKDTPPPPPTNTCDGGEWLTKPTGSYKYCDPISYTAKAKDKDGIDKTSVVAKLNNVVRPSIAFTNETATSVDFSESSTTTNCLPVGTYTLDLSWKDKKGASSTNCALTTTFSILAEEQNPDWEITKTAAEQCIESGDAQIIYTIKIKNTGTGAGSISKMVDTLDSKVLASYITGTISYGGLFGSGNITWESAGFVETFAPGEEKTATYTLVIPNTAFGSYTNTVTAYPTEGENFSDNVTVTVDCEPDIPQTGLFDSTVAKIVAGIVLLLLGFNLHRADTGFGRVQSSLHKLSTSMQDSQDERRKRNFEKKIVKK